ncbi:MAG TPA: HAMP domain-containing sensor histidine kinase [Mycobacteriales bacterium]
MTDAPWWDLARSLRSRLVAVAALAVAVAVAGVVGIAYAAVRHELRAPLDSQLRSQAGSLQRQAATNRSPFGIELRTGVGQLGGYAQVVSAGGDLTPLTGGGVALPTNGAERDVARGTRDEVLRTARLGDVRVRMLTRPLLDGFAVQVALPTTTADAQLRRIAVSFATLALLGVALATALAWFVSRRALAPVTGLTETAERIAATRDLTVRIDRTGDDEIGRLAASFNTMLGALEQSVGAQRQLVADASHELRTPLASLRTNVELLHRVDELPEDVRREMLDAIVGQVGELTALVSDVVELARGDALDAAVEDVAFDELVERCADRARRHWPAHTFAVSAAPVTVRAAPARLERAVTNLLDNAAKFSGSGPVEVALRADGVLTVRDHGPGVPEAALPNVFGRFYRADEARALPGSGLGLAIVQQAAEALGGRVTLRNAPDGGAVAELTVPAVRAER